MEARTSRWRMMTARKVTSSRFKEVFEDGLGRFTGGKVGFALREGARPVFLRARPLPYALREPVERALDQLVRDGIITPVPTSDWATPVVPVMKKDGTIRLCGDFKLTLNKCLQVDHFPVPRVDDLLTKLHRGDKFSKIDLSQAYAQFELDESKQYTVINTHKGLYMYNRLIYGLASSPGIFQRKLEQLFADLPTVGVFLDDIIITGADDRAHLETLTEVFERLRKYGLKVKKEKCTFFAPSVTYLGFVISKKGVHTCPDKIKAIKEVDEPSNVSELRSFLGLIMYYAKFVPNISTILAPLYRLLQKNVSFIWDENCRAAFNKIKQMLISSAILAHYSPHLPLILTTDASSVGVGAVISHLTPEGERPIAYASRVLNSEKAYSQIEREALSIIYGIKKFHQYLYGRKFTLRTDHKPLVSIFGDKSGIPVMAASRMQRWAVILAGYDYDIEYVRSEKNSADALSRLPVGIRSEPNSSKCTREVTYLNFVQNFVPITRKTLCQETGKDNILTKVMLFIQSGWPAVCTDEQIKPYFSRRHELYIDTGCIVWGYRLVIPKTLRNEVLKEVHSGHMGIVKMKSIARSIVWWPGIDAEIESVCKACTTCTAESTAPAKAAPQPWPYESEVWSRLHLDFMGPIQGASFLVLIDSTSKWIEVFRMNKTTANDVIRVLRETFARFGLPKEIVSDNGPPFSSQEYERFMTFNGIKTTFAPIYHPSSNGAAELAVKLCKRVVRKAIRDGVDVDAALQSYLLSYRNVDHSTTGASPAALLQRRTLRTRLDLLKCRRQLEDKVIQSQRKQVEYAGGVARQMDIGEEVWARNYTGGERWIGGKIEQKLGSRNYIVSRENGPPIKRHIDQLKTKWASTIDVSVPNSPNSVEPPNEVPTCTAALPVTGGVPEPGPSPSELRAVTEPLPGPPVAPPTLPAPVEGPKPTRARKPVKRYGFDFD
ncbi:uncharacterized protein K02A2.6-like [Leguminivora glycinivorella]|uniref:uncharacterized protein K02A2.6-like n=1 Tax=Leguminivora glycinivorella TaxID=1035111 RepID=UPI00200D7D55|nr:uncharacterized protein K02A2.6-like [Leguminivora glycinivorella]